ncbi:unnamed protein product, partial [Symbiodinium microadriaticum]
FPPKKQATLAELRRVGTSKVIDRLQPLKGEGLVQDLVDAMEGFRVVFWNLCDCELGADVLLGPLTVFWLRPSRTPPLCTCEANLFLEVQSEDRIITTVQLYTWALMMALMLAGFLCSPDLSSRCEEANFQAVQCEGSAFLRRDRPMADSVASQADCTDRKKGSTQRESRALPEMPCNVLWAVGAADVPFPRDDDGHRQGQRFFAISGWLGEKGSDEAGLHEGLEGWNLGMSAQPREGFEDRSGADLADLAIFLEAIFACMQKIS